MGIATVDDNASAKQQFLSAARTADLPTRRDYPGAVGFGPMVRHFDIKISVEPLRRSHY